MERMPALGSICPKGLLSTTAATETAAMQAKQEVQQVLSTTEIQSFTVTT
jgi:hypothetical protein